MENLRTAGLHYCLCPPHAVLQHSGTISFSFGNRNQSISTAVPRLSEDFAGNWFSIMRTDPGSTRIFRCVVAAPQTMCISVHPFGRRSRPRSITCSRVIAYPVLVPGSFANAQELASVNAHIIGFQVACDVVVADVAVHSARGRNCASPRPRLDRDSRFVRNNPSGRQSPRGFRLCHEFHGSGHGFPGVNS